MRRRLRRGRRAAAGDSLFGGQDDADRWRLLSAPVVGWVLYDFASTTFSFVVVARYFSDWIVEERQQPDIYLGLMVAVVSLALVVALPVLGAVADRRGRHKPILVAFTLLCVAATGLLGVVESVLLALVVGGIATFAFNIADAQYHPLLGVVAPEHKRGRVSGAGVAIGLLAPLGAVLVIGSLVEDGHTQRAFLPAAAIVLAFALPLFVLVREHPRRCRGTAAPLARPLAQLVASVRRARAQPHGRFILARFFYLGAVLTALQFMTVYARRTGDFDGAEIDMLIAMSAVVAIAGAIAAGVLAERAGPRLVVLTTVAIIVAALVLAAASSAGGLLWVVGPALGASLGSLSAVDRVYLLRLVPPGRRGEDFGLYTLAAKLASGLGPLVLWGGAVLVATELAALSELAASRIAVLALATAAVAGFVILRPLPDRLPDAA